ncbi:MAG TPA: hypothetical protein VGK35_07590 [Actinotalea sp.]
MPLTRTTGLRAYAQTDPRTARRSLRAEKAQLLRWRRLLRARLDLAVAAFAPPQPLGEATWELLPEAEFGLPLPAQLMEAIQTDSDGDQVALMHHLRHLDDLLAAYGAEIDSALESSTQQIVRSMAVTVRRSDPARDGTR